MGAYFIRRLLLIPFTFIGITLLVFTITRLAPGGPMDALKAARQAGEMKKGAKEEKTTTVSWQQALEDQERFDFHKSIPVAYLRWFGALPREVKVARAVIKPGMHSVKVALSGSGREVEVKLDGTTITSATVLHVGKSEPLGPEWMLRVETKEELTDRWLAANGLTGFPAWLKRIKGIPVDPTPPGDIAPRVMICQEVRSGLLQGDLRRSYRYNEPVWEMMVQRFPVSTFYGILDLLAIYIICVPLGVLKAIRHRTFVDNASSALIFMGYAVPGYALASVLLLVFGANLAWFPMSGFTSDNFAGLGPLGKLKDIFSHAVMPLMCYMVGAFAFTTMMVKNSLMDNLAADYVRTAVSKGVTFPRAVITHALRNSLIPLATTFGQHLGLFLMGSFIIEKIFDIDGFGLLGFNSALERDYMMTMGILTVSSLLMLLGNVLSDFLVALTDPRVSYK